MRMSTVWSASGHLYLLGVNWLRYLPQFPHLDRSSYLRWLVLVNGLHSRRHSGSLVVKHNSRDPGAGRMRS